MAPFSIALAVFLEALDLYGVVIILPNIVQDFEMSYFASKSIIITYICGVFIMIPLMPWISSIWDTKASLLTGIFLFGTASAACFLSESLEALLISRFTQGLSAGMMGMSARAFLAQITPTEKLPKTMGYVAFPAMIAPAIGAILAGILADTLGWRFFFLISIPLAIVVFLILFKDTHKAQLSSTSKLDLKWSCLIVAALILATISLDETNTTAWGIRALSVSASLLCGILYWLHAKRKGTDCAIPLSFFSNTHFRNIFLGSLFLRIGVSGVPLFISLTFNYFYHTASVAPGIIIAMLSLGMTTMRPFSGKIHQKAGHKNILCYTVLITLIGMLLLGGFLSIDAYYSAAVVMFILGSTLSVAYNSIHSAVYEASPIEDAMRVTSLMALTQQLPIALGVLIITSLISILFNYGIYTTCLIVSLITGGITSLAAIPFTKLQNES